MSDKPHDAERERAAIVEWLRKEANNLEQAQANCEEWSYDWLSLRDQVESAQETADAIERLDHHKEDSHD